MLLDLSVLLSVFTIVLICFLFTLLPLLDNKLDSKLAPDAVVEPAELVTRQVSLEVTRIEVIRQVEYFDPPL